MKIVADESVDGQIVTRLRSLGHEVLYIAELEPGIADDLVLQRSRDLESVLLTADKDFGELVFRRRLIHVGVVLIRLSGLTPDEKAHVVAEAFSHHSKEMSGGFAVISNRVMRFRRRQ